MNCKICKQDKFISKSKRILTNGYISRTKECKKCGYTFQTIELPKEKLNKYIRLVEDLKKSIKIFLKP